MKTHPSIQHYLDDLRFAKPDLAELVNAVRSTVHRCVPPVDESIKYGGIVFSTGPMFAGVFAYTQHVSVEFSEGAELPDEHGFLEGAGKHRRHLKLRSVDDIERKQLAAYLSLAVEHIRPNE